jgi:hypothetical protein
VFQAIVLHASLRSVADLNPVYIMKLPLLIIGYRRVSSGQDKEALDQFRRRSWEACCNCLVQLNCKLRA